jgi:hypothetical protein
MQVTVFAPTKPSNTSPTLRPQLATIRLLSNLAHLHPSFDQESWSMERSAYPTHAYPPNQDLDM